MTTVKYIIPFKEKYSFYERLKESQSILSKYLNKIPIICVKPTKIKVPNIKQNF